MATEVPWDAVPEQQLIPTGLIDFNVDDIDLVTTKETDKKMVKMTLRAVAPPEVEGRLHWEYFVLGSDDDPAASDPMTLTKSTGMGMLKGALKGLAVPLVGSLEEVLQQAIGNRAIINVAHKKDKTGEVRARLTRWFKVGEREPGLGNS